MNNRFSNDQLQVGQDNESMEDKIRRSRDFATQAADKAQEQLGQGSQLLGAELLKSSFEKLGGAVSKATGFKSINNLSKNIKDLGYEKGFAKTVNDAKQEAIQKGKTFGEKSLNDLKTKASSIIKQSDPNVSEIGSDFEKQFGSEASSGASLYERTLGQYFKPSVLQGAKDTMVNNINKKLSNRGLEPLNEIESSNSPKDIGQTLKQRIQESIKSKSPSNIIDNDTIRNQSESYQPNITENIGNDIGEDVEKSLSNIPRKYTFGGGLGQDFSEQRAVKYNKLKELIEQKKQDIQGSVQGAKEDVAQEINAVTGKKIDSSKPLLEQEPEDLITDDAGNILQDEQTRILEQRYQDIQSGKVDLSSPLEQSVQKQQDATFKKQDVKPVQEASENKGITFEPDKPIENTLHVSQQANPVEIQPAPSVKPAQTFEEAQESENILAAQEGRGPIPLYVERPSVTAAREAQEAQAIKPKAKPPIIKDVNENIIEPDHLKPTVIKAGTDEDIIDTASALDKKNVDLKVRLQGASKGDRAKIKNDLDPDYETNIDSLPEGQIKNDVLNNNYQYTLDSIKRNNPELLDDALFKGSTNSQFSTAIKAKESNVNSKVKALSKEKQNAIQKEYLENDNVTPKEEYNKFKLSQPQKYRDAKNANYEVKKNAYNKISQQDEPQVQETSTPQDITEAQQAIPAEPISEIQPAPPRAPAPTQAPSDPQAPQPPATGDDDEDAGEGLTKDLVGDTEGILGDLGGGLLGGLFGVAAMVLPSILGGDNEDEGSKPILTHYSGAQTFGLGN